MVGRKTMRKWNIDPRIRYITEDAKGKCGFFEKPKFVNEIWQSDDDYIDLSSDPTIEFENKPYSERIVKIK